MSRHVLVCYDICAPRRLRKVHKLMRDYGIAVQYSIFACRLRRSDQAALEAKLLEILDAGVDQVMLIDLGPVKRTEDRVPGARVLGRARGGGIRGVVVV